MTLKENTEKYICITNSHKKNLNQNEKFHNNYTSPGREMMHRAKYHLLPNISQSQFCWSSHLSLKIKTTLITKDELYHFFFFLKVINSKWHCVFKFYQPSSNVCICFWSSWHIGLPVHTASSNTAFSTYTTMFFSFKRINRIKRIANRQIQ